MNSVASGSEEVCDGGDTTGARVWVGASGKPTPEKAARFERTADMLAKSGLLDITMKTADLLRSNQQAQRELSQLKLEIEQFTKSVLANPENQSLARQHARAKFVANPLAITDAEFYVPATSPQVSVIRMAPSPNPRPF